MSDSLDFVKWNLQQILLELRNSTYISYEILDSMQTTIIQIGEIHNELCRLENDI